MRRLPHRFLREGSDKRGLRTRGKKGKIPGLRIAQDNLPFLSNSVGAVASPAFSSDFEWRRLLRAVSRSFYLSLRFLPAAAREPMSLAYLLARASDTLADAAEWSEPQRRNWLHEFRTALTSPDPGAPWLTHLAHEATAASPGGSLTPGERELLRRLPQVLAWFRTLPSDEQTLIRGVLEPITDGQLADLSRTHVTSAAELEHYTWQVAGCVGEFWTRLCALKHPRYALHSVDELIAHGVRFGQGLQLINILRDVPSDAARGRSYLPGVTAEASPEAKWAAAQPWLERCAAWLAEGRAYAAGVSGFRYRWVVWLPLRLAEETLHLLRTTGPAAMTAPVKVPRAQVKWLALDSALRAAGLRRAMPAATRDTPETLR